MKHDVDDEAVVSTRAETGAMQFGDDWPGLFLRGDDCHHYAAAIERLLDRPETDVFASAVVRGLLSDLRSTRVQSDGPTSFVQRLCAFNVARDTPASTPETMVYTIRLLDSRRAMRVEIAAGGMSAVLCVGLTSFEQDVPSPLGERILHLPELQQRSLWHTALLTNNDGLPRSLTLPR